MSLLARFEVTAYYGQVEISDPNKLDYPQFETGEERAVAIPDCIAVVTRNDREGPVTVEVWNQRLETDNVNLEPVYDGELTLSEARAVVGNTVGNEFYSIPLGRGRHRVKAFTSGAGERPEAVHFLVD